MSEVLSDFEDNDCKEEEPDEKPAAVKTTNNKNKNIKTKNTTSDNDEKINFMTACDEARIRYIKHQVREEKCNTYFKFENGISTKIDNPDDVDDPTIWDIKTGRCVIPPAASPEEGFKMQYDHSYTPIKMKNENVNSKEYKSFVTIDNYEYI